MTQFELPLTLANYIADYLDLPGLFFGTYEGIHVEYMHLTHIYRYGLQHQCIVIKAHGTIYGMIAYNGDEGISEIIELPAYDPIFELLKKHRDFPSGTYSSNGVLYSRFIFPGGMTRHTLVDPAGTGYPSIELDIEHHILIKHLTEKTHEYIHIPGLKDDESSFIRRHWLLVHCGQSSLFGQPEAPHDTVYLLTLDIYQGRNRSSCLFLKTRHDFQGIFSLYDSDKEMMLPLHEPDVDWRSLIKDAAKMSPMSNVVLRCRVILSFARDEQAVTFVLNHYQQDTPKLWYVLKTLIAQFPEG